MSNTSSLSSNTDGLILTTNTSNTLTINPSYTTTTINPNYYGTVTYTDPYLPYENISDFLKQFNVRDRTLNESLTVREAKYAANLYSCLVLNLMKNYMAKKGNKTIKVDANLYHSFLEAFNDLRERNTYLENKINKLQDDKFSKF